MKHEIGTNANEYQVFLPIEEWERLKRIDENIKNVLQRKRVLLDEALREKWTSYEQILGNEIKLLKSLYEDNK